MLQYHLAHCLPGPCRSRTIACAQKASTEHGAGQQVGRTARCCLLPWHLKQFIALADLLSQPHMTLLGAVTTPPIAHLYAMSLYTAASCRSHNPAAPSRSTRTSLSSGSSMHHTQPQADLLQVAARLAAAAAAAVLALGPSCLPSQAVTSEQLLFLEAWRAVDRAYVDKSFNGQNWFKVR